MQKLVPRQFMQEQFLEFPNIGAFSFAMPFILTYQPTTDLSSPYHPQIPIITLFAFKSKLQRANF